MSRNLNIMLAGFGGQGILFAGKIIAYAGMIDGREISWLPSYGPEMRGGTANCSVCISDEPIGSPLVTEPDALIAMNLPSYEKFIEAVVPGGVVIVDSTMVGTCTMRGDIEYYTVPATLLAEENGLKGLANVILVGKLLDATNFSTEEVCKQAIDKSVSAKHVDLVEANKRALKLGELWTASECQ
ncbi:MAG: 2-oxoacid:acceptor oxidoreductase family protein [Coriobacteriales bacterium]|jgi:2-oxoglutarate ferredoxin oxidoreductase subunit gamma|nr:2-oxoacid:acceptor oxidoreductase family protein [Coriobacteriales bacterium]